MIEEQWHAEAMRLVDNNSMAYFGFTRTGDKDKAETARDALAAHLRSRPDDAAIALLREARVAILELDVPLTDSIIELVRRIDTRLADKEPKT